MQKFTATVTWSGRTRGQAQDKGDSSLEEVTSSGVLRSNKCQRKQEVTWYRIRIVVTTVYPYSVP
jgi:hypothetical protein